MSASSWSLAAVALIALLAMAVAAVVEGSAGLISRERFRLTTPPRERNLQAFLDPRRSLVAALHLAQVMAVAIAASALTIMTRQEPPLHPVVIIINLVAALLLIAGQMLPRALLRTHPELSSGSLLGLARVVVVLVRPLEALGSLVTDILTRLLGGEKPDITPAGAEEELLLLSLEAAEDDVIEPEERAMIDNVLQLEETMARDIMVPRMDIDAVAEDATPREIVRTITTNGHSRIPVYRDSIDHIVGMLYAKDLLPFVIGSTRSLPIKALVRPPYYVPETKRIDQLLTELRRNRVHVAIVVDEYGGTAGLVTIEDILEEIVGEIDDEHDAPIVMIEQLSDDEVLVDGRAPIEEVEEALGMELAGEDDSFTTAAGFVHEHLDRLPQPGDTFEAAGLRAEVLAVEGHRLRRLRLIRLFDGQAPTPILPPGPTGPAEAAAPHEPPANPSGEA
ncbi:MAG: HlyC/CorC family transporter [Thermomicrobiales bacterium]|nr:HlyC/CorC family transporter [Thermomicrobiales bacterium]